MWGRPSVEVGVGGTSRGGRLDPGSRGVLSFGRAELGRRARRRFILSAKPRLRLSLLWRSMSKSPPRGEAWALTGAVTQPTRAAALHNFLTLSTTMSSSTPLFDTIEPDDPAYEQRTSAAGNIASAPSNQSISNACSAQAMATNAGDAESGVCPRGQWHAYTCGGLSANTS